MVPSHTSWSTPAAWYPAGHAAREVEEDQQGGVQHYHGQGDRAAYLAHAVVEGNAPGTIVLPTGRVDGMPWTHRAGKEGSDLGEGSKARTRRRKAPYTTLPGERWTHREAGKGPMLALHEVGGRCLPADAWKATMEGRCEDAKGTLRRAHQQHQLHRASLVPHARRPSASPAAQPCRRLSQLGR